MVLRINRLLYISIGWIRPLSRWNNPTYKGSLLSWSPWGVSHPKKVDRLRFFRLRDVTIKGIGDPRKSIRIPRPLYIRCINDINGVDLYFFGPTIPRGFPTIFPRTEFPRVPKPCFHSWHPSSSWQSRRHDLHLPRNWWSSGVVLAYGEGGVAGAPFSYRSHGTGHLPLGIQLYSQIMIRVSNHLQKA